MFSFSMTLQLDKARDVAERARLRALGQRDARFPRWPEPSASCSRGSLVLGLRRAKLGALVPGAAITVGRAMSCLQEGDPGSQLTW
jgi:hypothetical protein